MKPANDTDETTDGRSTDEADQGCVNCSPKESGPNKENVSLSISSDDETEQAISLSMNKKTTHIAYKGE